VSQWSQQTSTDAGPGLGATKFAFERSLGDKTGFSGFDGCSWVPEIDPWT
jgi:hypothetical protein